MANLRPAAIALSLLTVVALAPIVQAQQVPEEAYANLKWRLIGPFRGGRSLAVSGSVQRPDEYYFGATGGGLWKTTDAGQTWNCVTDGFLNTSSVGAVAVAPSNPDVIYIGMGEKDIRGDIAEGDGVYKSTDGGKTWTHMGLADTRTIARIIVHPTNPDVVYVGALGHIFGHNEERGLYKSVDGGKSWNKVLYVSDRAGVVDVEFEPGNPDVLYAATWECSRSPWSMNSGGPGSKFFKSADSGRTWTEITRSPGLPKGLIGKIGVDISPADPNRVYAIIEAEDGGVFRSDDRGQTWELVSNNRNFRQRAWYYTHVVADTKDKDTLYILNVQMFRSTDGGRTYQTISTPHADHHDLWIAPDNPDRMIVANDGGGAVSVTRGRNWTAQNFPTAQIYHVSTDNDFPYRLLGAQQDSTTIRIPSRTFGAGIGSADWTSTAGGESGYVAAKPDDPDVVFGGSYGGLLTMRNHRTNQSRNVSPWPDNPMGSGAVDLVQRFQWTFPIVFSPHDPNVLYTCSQYVLKSYNGGETWMKISPDLSRNDPATMGPSGGDITKDNTSVEYYGTVFTLAESPIVPGLMWAGSDDGLIHVGRGGGGLWENVTPRDMPEWGRCSMVDPSPHDPAVAYMAVNNYQNNDLKPYIFRTRNYGKSWQNVVKGIPEGAFLRAVREDPVVRGLLYAGTELGVYVSFDDGEHWQPLQMNLPISPVHDLAVKEGDLCVATHGRSFWILDDLSPIRQLAYGVALDKSHLFKPADAYRVRFGGGGPGGGGGRRPGGIAAAEPMAENPLSGFVVNYWLPGGSQSVRLELVDPFGSVVATQSPQGRDRGLYRTSLWPSYPSYRRFPGMIFWSGGGAIQGPAGLYTVRLTVDGVTQSQTARFLPDPRSGATEADLVEQFRFATQIRDRVSEANDAVVIIRDLRTKLAAAMEGVDDRALRGRVDQFNEALSVIENAIYQTRLQSGQDPLNYPIKLNNKLAALLGVVAGGNYRPTHQSYEVYAMLSGQLQVQLDALAERLRVDLPVINAGLRSKGKDAVVPVDPTRSAGGPAGGDDGDDDFSEWSSPLALRRAA
ncbi:MAG: WD40/YVTN/BNR-like repeat-containing protein [Fimbriimonadaceae bacterium]